MSIQKEYTSIQWDAREAFYLGAIGKITIPYSPTTGDIKRIGSELSELYCELGADIAYIKRKYETLDRYRKLAEKELFFIIKSAGLPGIKTEADTNGAVAIAIKAILAKDILAGNPMDAAVIQGAILTAQGQAPVGYVAPVGVSLLQALRIVEERLIFVEQIAEIIKDKKQTLISDLASLKLESFPGSLQNDNDIPVGNY